MTRQLCYGVLALLALAACVDDKKAGGGDGGFVTDSGRRDAGGSGDCDGCVDSDGDCVSGTSPLACGARGGSCDQCATGEECAEGRCLAPPTCDPSTCTGCCDGDACAAGTDDLACGSDGLECTSCVAPATCVDGRCVAPCAAGCDGCCLDDGTCVEMGATDAASCGSDGALCMACAGNEECVEGACVVRNCAVSCAGCCMGNTCVDPGTDAACGAGGAACVDCMGATCTDGMCEIPGDSRWDVVAVDGELPERNAGGSAWDPFGGLPDPYIVLTADPSGASVRGQSANQSNTTMPAWVETVLSDVPASTLMAGLNAQVLDSDVDGDDSFGTCSFTLDAGRFPSSLRLTCPADTAAGRAGWVARIRIEEHTP